MSHRRSNSARRQDRRPRLEHLEPRHLLTTFPVTTTADGGAGSLRAAIVAANSDGGIGVDEIDFAIGSSGTQKIQPATALPTITRPVFINGKSEPGYAGTPLVDLDGGLVAAGNAGLTLTGGSSTVEGLQITHFSAAAPMSSDLPYIGGQAILLQGPGGDLIASNFLGVISNVDGTVGNGLGVEVDAPNETIGGVAGLGNVISGNATVPRSGPVVTLPPLTNTGSTIAGDGVLVDAVAGAVIQGNRFGTAPSQSFNIPNGGDAIGLIGSIAPLIGGPAPGEGNAIAGGGGSGIFLDAATDAGQMMDATIQGNYIGLDSNPNHFGVGNTQDGILALGGGNTIGGTTQFEANVIGDNLGNGIYAQMIDASGRPVAAGGANLIVGNYIGMTKFGDVREGNAASGIEAFGGGTIGGSTAGAGNLISGNGTFPRQARDAGFGIVADGYTIQGNIIGLTLAGTSSEGNGAGGVALQGSDTLGGTTPLARNVISGNEGNGVLIESRASDPVVNIVIQGNSIGTDLSGTGPIGNFDSGIDAPDTYPDAPAPTGPLASILIGGPDPGDGNVISGNHGSGVFIGGNGNVDPLGALTIQGNLIGADATDASPAPNDEYGIALFSSVSPVTIGGTAAGEGNTIANNQGIGVAEAFSGATIVGNAIDNNVYEFGASGPQSQLVAPSFTTYTPPTLTGATTQGNFVTIYGAFAGAPGEVRTFDFFASKASGSVGGEVYLGSATATADANGLGSIGSTFPVPAATPTIGPGGSGYTVFTATAIYAAPTTTVPGATGNFGGTSTFSNPVVAQDQGGPSTDLALAEVSGPTNPQNPAASGTFSYTVTNAGTNPATGVTLNEYFPAGGPLLSATTTAGYITFTSDGNFVASLGTIAPGQSVTITFRAGFSGVAGSSFSAEALVASQTADPVAGNNSLTSTVPVSATAPTPSIADLSLAGAGTPGTVAPGGQVVYDLTATNLGPDDATDAVLFFTLAADMTLVSASSSQGNIDIDPGATSGGILSAYFGTIGPDLGATLTITVAISSTATSETDNVRGVVRSDETDPAEANNYRQVATAVS